MSSRASYLPFKASKKGVCGAVAMAPTDLAYNVTVLHAVLIMPIKAIPMSNALF
jgi:hypothetical protein